MTHYINAEKIAKGLCLVLSQDLKSEEKAERLFLMLKTRAEHVCAVTKATLPSGSMAYKPFPVGRDYISPYGMYLLKNGLVSKTDLEDMKAELVAENLDRLFEIMDEDEKYLLI